MVPQTKHDVFQAISDPTRRGLLILLAKKEMSVTEISKCFPISRTAINKHLHLLSEVGLLTNQKIGRETRYVLKPEPLVEIKNWLSFFDRYWDEKLFVLKQFVESDKDETL